MSTQNQDRQTWKLLVLGIPVLILVFASIALTAYLSVDLIAQGLRDRAAGPLVLGTLIAALWLLMFYKTARTRGAARAV